MESVFILVLVVIVIILMIRGSGNSQPSNTLMSMLIDLKSEIASLQKDITRLKMQVDQSTDSIKERISNISVTTSSAPPSVTHASPTATFAEEEYVETIPQIVQPVVAIPEIVVEQRESVVTQLDAANEETEQPLSTLPEPGIPVFAETEMAEEPISLFTKDENAQRQQPVYEPAESSLDRWFRNNPDLEKFIGENLINKIGIAILVLGIAFFVKFAIDKEWINEVGRVCIGLGCGALLVGLAHFLRNSYRSFSSVLAGGGIAVFYFTIAFAFHQYHLMSQTAAFIIMVVITGFAIALSILYNKLELAIIATVGGFITPFLVSTGDGNYIVLFTYLIILNCGILTLANFKRWPAINIIALVFTEIIYGGWLGTVLNDPTKVFSYPLALLFATAFYFIFLGMNMLNQVRNKAHFRPFDFIILLLISSSYYGAGMLLLHNWNNGMYQGLFTLGMGIINLALTYFIYKNGKADRNLLFLLIGITLTFITLTIPIQLHGHAITLFWSAEFVLLYWLSVYSGIRVFKFSSGIICLLTLLSLGMDWENAVNPSVGGLHLIFTNIRGIVTNLVASAAFAGLGLLLLKARDEEKTLEYSNRIVARVVFIVSVLILYLTCIFGVNLYFHQLTSYTVPSVYHRMITEIFVLVFVVLVQRKKIKASPWLQVAFLSVCFLMLLVSQDHIIELRNSVLAGKEQWLHLISNWLDSLLLAALFYLIIQGIRKEKEVFKDAQTPLSIVISLMVIAFLSIEFLHIYVVAAYSKNNTSLLEGQFSKAGLTVLWAMCSFALMWLGMKHRHKTFRIISLVLFGVVLLKLFILDISDISEGGKILAFILLGVLLLTISFMYQKLKKIIIDDKKE